MGKKVMTVVALLGVKMSINKGGLFVQQDVYIDYPFEGVMYRWDHKAKKTYETFNKASARH